MLLTIATTHSPATDLGFLLRKHPEKLQTFNLTFGQAHLFYPDVNEHRCTAALLLEVDPVGLVRNKRTPSGDGRALEQYVNDRPYVASSFLSVAISEILGSALNGKAKEKAELVELPIPLEVKISSLPCRAGTEMLRRLFEPLGYHVEAEGRMLDDHFPEWGPSPYYNLKLSGQKTVQELLSHIYVLIPVLDNDKHYWVGDDEVDKLLRHGDGWLAQHPEKELITRRYLKHKVSLVRDALSRLLSEDETESAETEQQHAKEEAAIETRLSLNEQRMAAVLAALKQTNATRVMDLGCGEGRLISQLLKDKQFEEIVGMDVSYRSLEVAKDKLKFDRLPPKQQKRVKLIHGSLIYRDKRLFGYDAATVVEVVEHLDPPRLAAFERSLFRDAKPDHVIVTTPNSEYNVMWETLPAGKFRHRDHRFEWTRAQFQEWANRVATEMQYEVSFASIGPEAEGVGSPTQMALFKTRTSKNAGSEA
ncbi:MAG: 3' terminal RNA ribose 2'-O-methyltransferase Hen1 [Verrucomicrobiales bacterium]